MNIVGNVAGAGQDQEEMHGFVLTVVLPGTGEKTELLDCLEADVKEEAGLTDEHQHHGVSPFGPSPSPTLPVMDQGTVCAQATASLAWYLLSGTACPVLASCPGASLLL